MENVSPFLGMEQVERQLKELLRSIDVDLLDIAEKKAFRSIRQLALDARLDIRDYELSETRDEQLKKMQAAKRRLDKLEKAIVTTGSLFGAADVAQLSAQIQQISSRLI